MQKDCKEVIDYSLDFAVKDEHYNKIDTFFIAGDITNKGSKEEFDAFKEIYDYAADKGAKFLCTVAKGHDSITMGKKSLEYYKSLTNQETDFHIDSVAFKKSAEIWENHARRFHHPVERHSRVPEIERVQLSAEFFKRYVFHPRVAETSNTAVRMEMAIKPTTMAIATIRIGSSAFVKEAILRSISF